MEVRIFDKLSSMHKKLGGALVVNHSISRFCRLRQRQRSSVTTREVI